MIEFLGYIGMIIVLVSFTMRNMLRLRILNSIACGIFVFYGIMHGTVPIVIMNILVILINLYYIKCHK
jgi:hypothetical protein